MAIAESPMTAEEFGRMPDDGRRTELVRGRIVELPPPKARHGQVCSKASRILGNHAEAHDLGHVLTNDSGIVTEQDPDTVRGADIAFFRYENLPKGPLPQAYLTVAPDLVVEVRSRSDRWPDLRAKVDEFLALGVPVVCVLDPDCQAAHLFYPDRPERTLGPDDELTLPECLGDFRVAVRRFFE